MAVTFDDLIPASGSKTDQPKGASLSFDDLIPKKKRKRNVYGEIEGAMANVNRGLSIADEMAGAFKAVGDVATGRSKVNLLKLGEGVLRSAAGDYVGGSNVLAQSGVGDAYRKAMAEQRQTEDEYMQDRPMAANLAKGVGMAGTMVVPGGQAGNLLAASRPMNVARGVTGAMTTAAGYAAADRGTTEERLRAANAAAFNPVTIGLGALGGALAPTAPKPQRVKPVSKDVKLLAEEGVQLTPGQMRGGMARSAEEAGTSLPMLGTAISERRTEGVKGFNRAIVNRALKPIG